MPQAVLETKKNRRRMKEFSPHSTHTDLNQCDEDITQCLINTAGSMLYIYMVDPWAQPRDTTLHSLIFLLVVSWSRVHRILQCDPPFICPSPSISFLTTRQMTAASGPRLNARLYIYIYIQTEEKSSLNLNLALDLCANASG